MAQDISSIADASKPNAGRIYDYLLGGHHNFEIDRQAAQQVIKALPLAPEIVRLVRWFLGEAVRRLCDEGYRYFLDFASGLPTVDHIHQIAPQGSKVIYSDIDPVTVAYAQEIVEDEPDIRYVSCDAAKAQELLESDVVAQLFGSQRRITIGFNGIAWFLPDESVAHTMKVLYDWAGEGSKLFISDCDQSHATKELLQVMEMYKNFGQPGYLRTQDTLLKLIGPWRVADPGFMPLEQWIDIEDRITEEVRALLGFGMSGVILQK